VVLALFFVLEATRATGRSWLRAAADRLFSVCPLYTVLGLNICPMKKA